MADEDTTTEAEDTTAEEAVEETTDDTTEDTTEAAKADEWTPPTREEWEKSQKESAEYAAKWKKSNADAGRHRAKVAELTKASEDADTKAQREAVEAAQAKYKPIVAKNALLEAKARTDRVGGLIKLLNMDTIEFAGEDVVGLDAEVERLQEEFPELFVQEADEKPAPRPAPKAATAPKKPVKTEEKSAGERIAAQLLGTR
jgi:hypothetical protein